MLLQFALLVGGGDRAKRIDHLGLARADERHLPARQRQFETTRAAHLRRVGGGVGEDHDRGFEAL